MAALTRYRSLPPDSFLRPGHWQFASMTAPRLHAVPETAERFVLVEDPCYREAEIAKFDAWSQFHRGEWVESGAVQRDVVFELGYPVFRGRICVKPPLDPDDKETLRRLDVMERCFNQRWHVDVIARCVGISEKEAIERFGPEGEFFDHFQVEKRALLAAAKELGYKHATVYPTDCPPRSQPPGYCKFHYWEDSENASDRDAPTNKRKRDDVATPSERRGYLVWNLREKFYWPVEWLAYLAQTIFHPLGRRLDGEIEWWDTETMGTIRLEDSRLTIARFETQDVGSCEFECASCIEALEGGRPTGVPVSDKGLSESAKEILALLPVGCTWAHAAKEHLICRYHDPAAVNDVLQRLPACEPVHRRFCLEQNIESAKEIRDFLKKVESTQVTLAWDRIVQLLAEGGVVNPHWYVDRYDSDEPWEWNCHRDVLVSIPKLAGDAIDAAVEGHEEPKSAWEILKQYCVVV